jgi:hypothetical protein
MPAKEGRSGTPGNSTVYHPINIATSNPSALQPKDGGASVKKYPKSGQSISWLNNKFTEKGKKSY